MSRFYEFKTELLERVSESDAELRKLRGEKPSFIDAKIQLNLDDVSAFREHPLDEDDNDTIGQATMVYMRFGETYWLEYPYDDFCKLMRREK